MKCSRKGCPNVGHWQVMLHLWAPDKRGSPAKAGAGLVVCAEHKKEATVEDFVTEKGRAQLAHAFESIGKVVPDFDLTELHFRLVPGDWQPDPFSLLPGPDAPGPDQN